MFCSQCGSRVSDIARFCRNCGARLEETKAVAKTEELQQGGNSSATANYRERLGPEPRTGIALADQQASVASARNADVPKPSVLTSSALITVGGTVWLVYAVAIAGIAIAATSLSLGAVASACLTAAYGLALIRKNASAIPLGWIVVVLLGLGVLLNGIIPLHLIAWLLALGFTLFVQRRRKLFT